MTAWHENARFDIFCECDVYVESPGRYLYVENTAHNYHGDYVCNEYQQGTNVDNTAFYMRFDTSCVSNEYIAGLEKAPWNVARDIIGIELDRLKYIESMNEADKDESMVENIEDAMRCLMEYAVEGEKFTYC